MGLFGRAPTLKKQLHIADSRSSTIEQLHCRSEIPKSDWYGSKFPSILLQSRARATEQKIKNELIFFLSIGSSGCVSGGCLASRSGLASLAPRRPHRWPGVALSAAALGRRPATHPRPSLALRRAPESIVLR